MNYNNSTQTYTGRFFKNIPLKLIVYRPEHFARLNAKRFMLGNPKYGQNIWIPNRFLEEDGTIRKDADLDWAMTKAVSQNKFKLAHLTPSGPIAE